MRSKLRTITARTPSSNVPFAAQVARAAGAVLLAAERHGRDAFGDVFHRSLVDRHLLAGGLVDGDAAFDARAVGLHGKHQVLDAHVAEGAAHHDLVVAAARAEAVELGHRHVMLLQIDAAGKWA